METTTLTVSLSGGVDSMVCTYLLWAIGQPFQALHINYSNRPECDREEELLRYWCGRLECPLFIRRIQEINRPLCMSVEMREIYESYTYDIRFMAYRNLSAPVVMGHNRDDCIENIFTNILHCRGYDNLNGMTQDSQINGIRVLRPLLDIPKTEIYDFATLVNIPHLVDSTPGWSQRGRIRDNIVPALVGWNPQMLDSLVALASTVGEMAGLIDELIPAVTSLSFVDLARIPINGFYWTKIFQKAGIQVTKKTVIQLLDRLGQLRANPGKSRTIKFTLAKDVYLQLDRLPNETVQMTIKRG